MNNPPHRNIWDDAESFGIKIEAKSGRMYLSQEQAKSLAKKLLYFAKHGVLKEEIDGIPAADVVERKRGTWRKRMETSSKNGYKAYTPVWSCSNCGKDYDPAICSAINFCYGCGADMREES